MIVKTNKIIEIKNLFKKGIYDLWYPYSFPVRSSSQIKDGFYFIDVTDILKRTIYSFHDGVPVVLYNNIEYHNPSIVSLYAIYLYEMRLMNSFLNQVRWLLKQLHAGALIYNISIPQYNVFSTWKSAMAQGLVISTFTRAFKLTNNLKYYNAALEAAEVLCSPIEKGGCSSFDQEGLPFLEEVTTKPTHILNGAIFGLWGLYDLELINNIFHFSIFKKKVIERIIKNLHLYDATYWSYYDLSHLIDNRQILSSRGYHMLHISQLKVLYILTEEEIFNYFAEKWEKYLKNYIFRMKVFLKKFYQYVVLKY